MSSKKKIWIATVVALVACVAWCLAQRSGNAAVRGEISHLKKVLASSPPSAARLEETAQESADRAVAGLPPAEELVAMLSDDDRDPSSSFRSFAVMLERIKHYSTEEVLTLIEELERLAKSDESQAQKIGFPRMMLMIIAAEDAPERILEMAKDLNDEVRLAAFSGLVKKDPQRARAYLEEVEWTAREVQKGKAALFAELLKRDVTVALDLFRASSWELNAESTAAIGVACKNDGTREKLWLAAREESDAAVRLQLSKGLIAGELVRGGAKGMRQAFASADFFDAKLKAELVEEFAGEAMSSEPDETTTWIREAVPPQDVPMALAAALGSWARKDFNAAGTWLGKQAPSPERDQAITSFASTVAEIDPAAAATWANEISDPTLRETTLEKTLKQWKAKDPAAAEAWNEAQE